MPYYPAARSETYDHNSDPVRRVAGLWRGEPFSLHQATSGSFPSAPPTSTRLRPSTLYTASAGWTFGFLCDGFHAIRLDANVFLSGAAEIRVAAQIADSAGATYVDVHEGRLAGSVELSRLREWVFDASGRQTIMIRDIVAPWIRFRTIRVNGAATSAPAIDLRITPYAHTG